MGLTIHAKLMLPPFPYPRRAEILFGPYENSLQEVQDELHLQHLFHNLDYYYMPSKPIRRSLIEPCNFPLAVEPIYNDKYYATEALTMLPLQSKI
jgi:hypothetical protein